MRMRKRRTPNLPVLPYAGTSGWSGSDTSHERATRDDSTGTTTERQRVALVDLKHREERGLTYKELGDIEDWHHGQSSGCLSVLHKAGQVARLKERRNRCEIYVLPEYVDGRETAPYRPNKGPVKLSESGEAVRAVDDSFAEVIDWWDDPNGSHLELTRIKQELLERLDNIVRHKNTT